MRSPLKATSRTQNATVDGEKEMYDGSYSQIQTRKDCDLNSMTMKMKQESHDFINNNGEKDKDVCTLYWVLFSFSNFVKVTYNLICLIESRK